MKKLLEQLSIILIYFALIVGLVAFWAFIIPMSNHVKIGLAAFISLALLPFFKSALNKIT